MLLESIFEAILLGKNTSFSYGDFYLVLLGAEVVYTERIKILRFCFRRSFRHLYHINALNPKLRKSPDEWGTGRFAARDLGPGKISGDRGSGFKNRGLEFRAAKEAHNGI